jgi:hypothetical protein
VDPSVKHAELKDCPTCGTKLNRRWPGNDPENGPAVKWCPSCGNEFAPCAICEAVFHLDSRPTPGRAEDHDSFGNGLPEVDAENERYERAHPVPQEE